MTRNAAEGAAGRAANLSLKGTAMPLASAPFTLSLLTPETQSQKAQSDRDQFLIGRLVKAFTHGVRGCVLLVACCGIAVCGCFAQSQCSMKPGEHLVVVPLQGAPNAFEPACQPARIRVNDRQQVIIRLTGLSPVDVCTASSKPPTPL